MRSFRIHGDNIVECERIANIIINETQPSHINYCLMASSTMAIDMEFPIILIRSLSILNYFLVSTNLGVIDGKKTYLQH